MRFSIIFFKVNGQYSKIIVNKTVWSLIIGNMTFSMSFAPAKHNLNRDTDVCMEFHVA